MKKLLTTTGLILSPSLALAHIGTGLTHDHGFDAFTGFLHPFMGLDHLLAMVSVGMIAAMLGGRALWLVPASFLTMMAVGGALAMEHIPEPFVEIAIALSVVTLGLVIATHARLSLGAAMGLIGFFALFHGYAHGVEMPETASGFTYGLAFLAATSLLHAIGILFGLAVGSIGESFGLRIRQATGAAMGLAGMTFLIGTF